MSQIIRLAVPKDCAAVEAIVAEAYAPYVPRIGRKPGPMLDDYAGLIRARLLHVLDDSGSIDGLLVLIEDDGGMLLDNIAVRPDAQGRGIGRRLMQFAEARARAAGHGSIRLYTHEAMTENIALYERVGYVETHRIEEQGFRRVYMTKTLR